MVMTKKMAKKRSMRLKQCWGSVTFRCGSGSAPDPTPFFSDFKVAKNSFFFIFFYNLPASTFFSLKFFCLNFGLKFYFASIISVRLADTHTHTEPIIWSGDLWRTSLGLLIASLIFMVFQKSSTVPTLLRLVCVLARDLVLHTFSTIAASSLKQRKA